MLKLFLALSLAATALTHRTADAFAVAILFDLFGLLVAFGVFQSFASYYRWHITTGYNHIMIQVYFERW